MTTLTTHDTKRSEDVRARLMALAEDGEGWAGLGRGGPRDRGAVPRRARSTAPPSTSSGRPSSAPGPSPAPGWRSTLLKAVREAKVHTAWVDGDADYEDAVVAYARAAAPRPGGEDAPRRVDRRARAVGAGEHPRPEARPADDARRPRRLPGLRDRRCSRSSTPTTAGPSTGPTAASASTGCSPTSRRSTSTTRSCASPPARCGVRRDLPEVFVGEAHDVCRPAHDERARARLRPRGRRRTAGRHRRDPGGRAARGLRRVRRRHGGGAGRGVARRALTTREVTTDGVGCPPRRPPGRPSGGPARPRQPGRGRLRVAGRGVTPRPPGRTGETPRTGGIVEPRRWPAGQVADRVWAPAAPGSSSSGHRSVHPRGATR